MILRGQRAPRSRVIRRLPWVTALATSAGLVASVLPASVLAYTILGLRRAEFWRLWTGHFVHYNRAHLWGDLLAFAVWAALVESESRRVLVVTLLLGTPLLSSAFAVFCPSVTEYRGLSSLDAALVVELVLLRGFAGGESQASRGFGPWLTRFIGSPALRAIGIFSLCLSALKIGYEFCVGHALLAPDLGQGVTLLPAAHAFGALLGVAVCSSLGRPTVGKIRLDARGH